MTSLNCWMCRHPNISQVTDNSVINSIIQDLGTTLECPICYDEFDFNVMYFTNCRHYACKECVNNMRKSNSTTRLRNINPIIDIIRLRDVNPSIDIIILPINNYYYYN